MKTVKRDGDIRRVSDAQAAQMIKNKNGWVYCPKSEWKARERKARPVV